MTYERLDIFTPDDSGRSYSTFVGVDGENMIWQEPLRGYRHQQQSNGIRPNYYRNEHEPTIKAIKIWLQGYLGWGKSGREQFNGFFIISKGMDKAQIHCSKIGNKYMIQGMVTTKDTAITAIARTVYRSCFETDTAKLERYCFNNILLPENVSYALENRAPYHWYNKGIKIDVRFNVRMIAADECAIEISDGIWAPISVKKMNTYMNYYWKGQKSSSWFKARLTPKKLWEKLLHNEPTKGQTKMMIAFLEQNRTDALVQKRAYALVNDLEKQYPDRIKVFWDEETGKLVKAMLIKGKIADWLITDNKYKSNIQAVSTYVYLKQNIDGMKKHTSGVFAGGILKGPICIDNMTKNSSIGDQFAARAMALLNDKITITLVSTINHYLSDVHFDGQYEHRINFGEVKYDEIDKVCNNNS